MKRVVVVGAGPCGLTALKEMLDGGHDAILLERSDRLGGLFSTSQAYPNLHLTISNWAMAFSDFPDPQRLCYSSGEEYLFYLQSYAKHFDLEKHIRYSSEVVNASLDDVDGKWTIQVKQLAEEGEPTISMEADSLVVSTGANHVPYDMPEGLKGYDGKVIYSNDYGAELKREVGEKKLKVLVIGAGESGADVSAELGHLSPGNVSVWLRRTPCFGPRYLNKRREMDQVQANKKKDFPVNGFLEAATTNRISSAQNVYTYGFWRRILWRLPILHKTLSEICLECTKSTVLRNDQATYVTKNQMMCEAIQDGNVDLVVCPSISSSGKTIAFQKADGTTEKREFDAVVLCTGYRTEFPWIKLPSNMPPVSPNPRAWYLHCFPEGVGHRLFFVGYARPHQGERQLPSDYADQARRDEEDSREYYFLSPNLLTLVDWNSYLESVARRVGCEPKLPFSCVLLYNLHMLSVLLLGIQAFNSSLVPFTLLQTLAFWAGSAFLSLTIHNGLLFRWYFYPQWAVWYRLRGPNAKPWLFEDMKARTSIIKRTTITRGFMWLVVWSIPTYYAQRLISPWYTCPMSS
ncbi:Flavin-containing monooxygenase 5-like protein [Cladobotryum mycophilum]|uniref:Flavin-containing monooxygenase 5-like protein n=1 Tax=Cladobotryum mycophilum TaxID=491253 RepID=A0ABR0S8V2_9HYPO